MIEVSDEEFREMIADAIDAIPELFARAFSEVQVLVQDDPGDVLDGFFFGDIFGCYARTPIPIIYIFRGPVLRANANREGVRWQLHRLIEHELGHHFGLTEVEIAGAHRRVPVG